MNKLIILGNGTDWCEASLVGFKNNEDVLLFNYKYPIKGNKLLVRIHFSQTLNSRVKLPFKSIWNRRFDDFLKLNSYNYEKDNVCMLIYDRNGLGGEESFIFYIRKKYPKIKMTYIFTNIVKYSMAREKGYVSKLNNWYDAVFAFDPLDATEYKFEFSPLIYDTDYSYKRAISKKIWCFTLDRQKTD